MDDQERSKIIAHIEEQVSIHKTMNIVAAFVNTNVQVKELDIQRIAGHLMEKGKYITVQSPTRKDDYYVFFNPAYDLEESMKATNLSIQRSNRLLKYTNVISTVIAAITGVFVALTFANTKADQSIQTRLDTLSAQTRRLSDSLPLFRKEINALSKTFFERPHSKDTNSLDSIQ